MPPPLQRRQGARADEAWLRARVDEARAAEDTTALRGACTALARWLASRDRDLDEAVELATTALSLGADVELRQELSTWLENLGEPTRAAAALKPLTASDGDGSGGAYLLVRCGLLKARAGAAAAALAAFETAMWMDADDPLPAELKAALGAWDPEAVPPSVAIDAYVLAAHRHAARGRGDAELADLWRAVGLDAASAVAANALADALAARGRRAAADEVLRAYANAIAGRARVDAAAVHLRRRDAARRAGDRLTALAAALDHATVALPDLGGGAAERGGAAASPSAADAADLVELLVEGGVPEAGALRSALAASPSAGAAALEAAASGRAGGIRAVLFAAAADRYARAGDVASARRAAGEAVRADPDSVRSDVAWAEATLGDGDRESVGALERVVGLVGPRAEWCAALSEAFDALGEAEKATAWAERRLWLRPGDGRLVDQHVTRLAKAADAARLADALAILLGQPIPNDVVSAPFVRGLIALAAADSQRAAVIARRALDVFGPRNAALRDAMRDIARAASDPVFEVVVLERWRASGIDPAARRRVLTEMIALFQSLGDLEAEARTIARAYRDGLGSPEIDARLGAIDVQSESPDAQLWRITARAFRADAASSSDVAVAAWRELGAALWDMADDRLGAVAAWRRAARIPPAGGYAVLTLDLVSFGGAPFAYEYLDRLIDVEPDDGRAAVVATEAGAAALWAGEPRIALAFAGRALARFPRHGGALEVAEPAAHRCGDYARLSSLYDLVAQRALGRFGRRAAHYRGARFFERMGEQRLAVHHASEAFRALSSVGSTLQLLTRTAERAGDRAQAVRTIEEVAEQCERVEARAEWLLRAAALAGDGDEAIRRKFDVLLRAVVAWPTVAAIALLRDAARTLLRLDPDERESVELRFARALTRVTRGARGPEGARIALACAASAIELFDDLELAMSSVESAFACDGDIDEYLRMCKWGPALARVDRAAARVRALLARAESGDGNVGVAALRLLAGIAAAIGDDELRARVAIAAALRDPSDDALVLAADEAVRGSPSLAGALGARVPLARRTAAIVAVARERVESGAAADAVPLFERAVGMIDEPERAGLLRELKAAMRAAGQEAEAEPSPPSGATGDGEAARVRADRWMEVAERREARDDVPGALQALREACKLDPESLERWSALERVSELADDDAVRVQALEEIAKRVPSAGRGPVFRRLARVHERRGDRRAAERAWHEVLTIDPSDEEADQAIEARMSAEGRYAELVDHMGARAERLRHEPGGRERLRAVRLRRAAILEQRLDRLEDACDELARLLEEAPDSPGALRYRADLLDRAGQHARSAPLWLEAAHAEHDPDARAELETRAGRALLASGDLARAGVLVEGMLRRRPVPRAALELRAELARASGDDSELGEALEALSGRGEVDAATRSDLLVEAAMAAARSGDLVRSLALAQSAAQAAPERATPQLLARGLEYRLRGPGDADDARRTLVELASIRDPLTADDAALRAFLFAEALDVAEGGDAAFRELEAVKQELGGHPLVALALAERLAARGDVQAAVESYRVALSGSLLDLRRPGQVALDAADVAIGADRSYEAAVFLDLAERHEELRAAAQTRRAALEARAASAPDGAPAMAPRDLRLDDLEAAVQGAPNPPARARARVALARALLEHGDARRAEEILWEALGEGLAEAGDLLAHVLAGWPERTRDLVRVRRQLVALQPGDLRSLEALHMAAVADGNRAYAAAVEHVLRAFDPASGPLSPPSLIVQPEQPGIFGLLTRPSTDPVSEALALLWEGATQLFVRDPGAYAITGIERVVPGSTSAIARLYEATLRILDGPRVPLYLRPAQREPSAQVAVLSAPSVIITGDARDESVALRFTLGRGISAALPQHVLSLGLPRSEVMAVLSAMLAAFGPPEKGRGIGPQAARLAESFWQLVPARAQRRLQQLLGSGALPEYEWIVARAHHVGRRLGMFLSGDFGYSARILLAELAGHTVHVASPEGLRAACEHEPMLTDLLCLAVSPEYAEARWQTAPTGSERKSRSSGRPGP